MNVPPNMPPSGGYGAPPPMGGPPPAMGPIPYGDAPFGVHPITGTPYSDKSKMVAGLLSVFLGSFGVGRFYLGHVGLGVAQLAITTLTCGLCGWIWPLIDAIFIFTGKTTDAQGRPLRE